MINNALRLIRIFHDKSQTELAEELGISKSYLSEIESGTKKVSIDILEKYSKSFSIAPSSLLLFSERLESNDFSEKTRIFAARKILKILDWIATKEEFSNA